MGDALAFRPAFEPFWTSGETADLACEVLCCGADATLASRPGMPDSPWSFTVRAGCCDVVRRNQAGEALWRLVAPLSFEQVEVTWNPVLFPDFFGSYERAWSTGLGICLLAFRLRACGGLVLHGTAADLQGEGILCLGVSGRGKSTLARLLDAEGIPVLTDERPIIRLMRETPAGDVPDSPRFHVYGSPWPSSAGFAAQARATLRRIYFLEHGRENSRVPLTPPEAFRRLLQVVAIPWQDPVLFDPCLETIQTLLETVPAAVLAFRPDASAVDWVRNGGGVNEAEVGVE